MGTPALHPEPASVAAPAQHSGATTLEAALPGVVIEAKSALGETTLVIAREHIRAAAAALYSAGYTALIDVTCLDMLPAEPRFHVVYHLLSFERKERLRLKVKVSGEDAAVDSVTAVWPAANFYEREVFDLFGVRFGDHPNMRRIMMPEDWQGHPLRKDYPVEGYR